MKRLLELADDEVRPVRLSVARNPRCPADALDLLARDVDQNVRWCVLRHPATPETGLRYLADLEAEQMYGNGEPVFMYRSEILAHPNAGPELRQALREMGARRNPWFGGAGTLRTGDGHIWSEAERNEGLGELYWDPLPHVDRMVGCTLPEWAAAPAVGEPAYLFYFGRWEERNWRNVPGPFYGAMTDTCFMGRLVAPEHVLYGDADSDGHDTYQEFLFRQPRSRIELLRVLLAVQMDPFSGWAADGDEHWTVSLVRDWWTDRPRLIEWLTSELHSYDTDHATEDEQDVRGGLAAYLAYLDGDLHEHLQAYAFWLDTHRGPLPGETLPTI